MKYRFESHFLAPKPHLARILTKIDKYLPKKKFGENKPDCIPLWEKTYGPYSVRIQIGVDFFVEHEDGTVSDGPDATPHYYVEVMPWGDCEEDAAIKCCWIDYSVEGMRDEDNMEDIINQLQRDADTFIHEVAERIGAEKKTPKLTPLKKLEAVSAKVKDWVENTFLPSFKTKEEMYRAGVRVAAVAAMQNWLDVYLIPTIKDDGEKALEDIFCEVSVDEFYDFFFKYEKTLKDIEESWIWGNEPAAEDILSLESYYKQTEDILAEMRYILDDLKEV